MQRMHKLKGSTSFSEMTEMAEAEMAEAEIKHGGDIIRKQSY